MYGDGSITKVEKGVWRVFAPPVKGSDGKVRRPSRVVHGSKADARKALRKLSQAPEPPAARDEFGEYAVRWARDRAESGAIGECTADGYASICRALAEAAGGIRLKDVDQAAMRTILARVWESKAAAGRPLAPATKRRYMSVAGMVMESAADEGMAPSNPVRRMERPMALEASRRSLSRAEGHSLYDAAERSFLAAVEAPARKSGASVRGLAAMGMAAAVAMAVETGMRLGEVLALTWGGVSLDPPALRVDASLTARMRVKPPKSRAGVRTVAVSARLAAILAELRARQEELLPLIGIELGDGTPVCCSERGGHLRASNFEKWWRRWREANGFGGLKFHELRHTQATQLLANGVDVKTVQARLGHSSSSVTLDIYAHALPENDRAASNLIAGLFS